jgi:hypothetical protein
VSRGGEDRRAQAKVLDLTDRQLRVRATLRCTVKGVSARRPGNECRHRDPPFVPLTARWMAGLFPVSNDHLRPDHLLACKIWVNTL